MRREPFQVLFPLAVLLAWAAVLPWVLFGTGLLRAWLGLYHALTMTEGFLVAVAVGFLGTMIPRRTGTSPLSTGELLLCAAGLLAVPLALLLERPAIAQAGYLAVLATLVQFVLRRVRRAKRPAPPSFVLLPLGLAAGATGAALIALASTVERAGGLLGAGRSLVEEGLPVALVLAVAPMLSPILARGAAPPDPAPATARRLRAIHLLAGALFLGSFAVQHAASERGSGCSSAARWSPPRSRSPACSSRRPSPGCTGGSTGSRSRSCRSGRCSPPRGRRTACRCCT